MRTIALAALFLAGAGAAAQTPEPAPINPGLPPSLPTQPEPAPETPAFKFLTIGDPAPKLEVAAWVKGGPIERIEPGNTHVVLFWASHSKWSKEALDAFETVRRDAPAGTVFIAISVWERALAAPNDDFLPRVRAFVEEHGKAWEFAVGADNNSDAMSRGWMHGADRRWIPAAFIIDAQGRIAWMGHPLDDREGLGEIVKKVAAGQWDLKAAADRLKQDTQTRDRLRLAGGLLRRALRMENVPEIVKQFDLLIEHGRVGDARLGEVLSVLLLQAKDYEAGYACLARAVDGPLKDDAPSLNTIAWFIADEATLEKRDLPLALRAAERAVAVTNRREAYIIDTLARAQFESGMVDEAVASQTEALGKAEPGRAAEYRKTLERYLAAKAAGLPPPGK